jgi:CubicO group peptidase (beta-lactamase class C family)
MMPDAVLMAASDFSAAMEAYMRGRTDADAFSGAVLVTDRHQPLFTFVSGWADRENRYPSRLDTRFNIASIGKSFTAAAIVQLAEQGKLSFSDTIGRHLPNYPRPAADTITIHHLLTHRSGLPPSFINDRFWALRDSLRRNRDYLQLFVDQPLAFEPGTMNLYSNPGYVVLGAIIESVAGEEYEEYMRRHIYLPAGMNQTDSPTQDPQKLSVGYSSFNGPPPTPRQRTEPVHGAQASGGGYSTVRPRPVRAGAPAGAFDESGVRRDPDDGQGTDGALWAEDCGVWIHRPTCRRHPHRRKLGWSTGDQRRAERSARDRIHRRGTGQLRSAGGNGCGSHDR